MPWIIVIPQAVGGFILCVLCYFGITSLNKMGATGIAGPEVILLTGCYVAMAVGVGLFGNGIWRIGEYFLKGGKYEPEPDPVPELSLGAAEQLPWEDTVKKNQPVSQQYPADPPQVPAGAPGYREDRLGQVRAAIYERRYEHAAQILNMLISQGYNDTEIVELLNYVSKQSGLTA